MEIQINGSRLDYELEEEKTVLEIVEAIGQWLSKEGRILEEIEVNGEEVGVGREDLSKRLIEETRVIAIKASSGVEYSSRYLLEVKEYGERVLRGIEEGFGFEKKDEIIEGLKWIREVLVEMGKILNLDTGRVFIGEESLWEVLWKYEEGERGLKESRFHKEGFEKILEGIVLRSVEKILKILPKILIRVAFEGRDLKEISVEVLIKNLEQMKEELGVFKPRLLELGVDLQTGRKVAGYQRMQNFLGVLSNLVEDLMRLDNYLGIGYEDWEVEGKKVRDINEGLKGVLEDFRDALERKDIILLGDIIEYEMMGKLELYEKILENFIVMIKNKF